MKKIKNHIIQNISKNKANDGTTITYGKFRDFIEGSWDNYFKPLFLMSRTPKKDDFITDLIRCLEICGIWSEAEKENNYQVNPYLHYLYSNQHLF